MNLKATIVNRGRSLTIWMSVVTVFLSLVSLPDGTIVPGLMQLLPPEALAILVILISIATGIKRMLKAGGGSTTPYMMGLMCVMSVLSLPAWGQILPPSSLPYLASVVSAITWYKRLFFPTSLEPGRENQVVQP